MKTSIRSLSLSLLVLGLPSLARADETFCVEYRFQYGYTLVDGRDSPERVLDDGDERLGELGTALGQLDLESAKMILRMSQKRVHIVDGGIFPALSVGGQMATVLDITLADPQKVLEVRRSGRGLRRTYTARVVDRTRCSSVVKAFANPYLYNVTDFPTPESKFQGDGSRAIAERTYKVRKNPDNSPLRDGEGRNLYIAEPTGPIRRLR